MLAVVATLVVCGARQRHGLMAVFVKGVSRIAWSSKRVERSRTNCAHGAESAMSEAQAEHWRDFRARLIHQSQSWAIDTEAQSAASRACGDRARGWVHASPLIEQGSLLLSRAGDHFAVHQPYFHKAAILILEHSDEEGDAGVILNRPMASSYVADGVVWPIWFGGPCNSLDDPDLDDTLWCLHSCDHLDTLTTEPVIKGLYISSFDGARDAVRKGWASADNFMVICGYCGWSAGQLQDELDSNKSWVMAAADAEALLGGLKRRQVALKRGLRSGGSGCSGAGVAFWRRLVRRLGLQAAAESDAEVHADMVVQMWCKERLGMGTSPWMAQARQLQRETLIAGKSVRMIDPLPRGTVLIASASDFILGVPDSWDTVEGVSLQYLHKGVLALIEPMETDESEAVAVLLNGPVFKTSGSDPPILFGGDDQEDVTLKAFGACFRGTVILPPGVLKDLVQRGALTLAPKAAKARRLMKLSSEQRWQAAGGAIAADKAQEAALGDRQRELWFRGFQEDVMEGEDLQLDMGNDLD